MDWKTVELLGYSYFSEKGYRILVSLVRNDGYDFVAEKDGSFLRVNVKTAGLKDKTNARSWSIAKASGSNSKVSKKEPNVDLYLVYLPDQNRFIELPKDFFTSVRSKSRRIPVHLFLS